MTFWYGLDGQPIDALAAEALLRDDLARRVVHTTLFTERGAVTISTMFLVLNHNYSGVGPPVLWETMVFGGPEDMDQSRYSSLDAAKAGHAEIVTLVKAALDTEGVALISEDVFTPWGGVARHR